MSVDQRRFWGGLFHIPDGSDFDTEAQRRQAIGLYPFTVGAPPAAGTAIDVGMYARVLAHLPAPTTEYQVLAFDQNNKQIHVHELEQAEVLNVSAFARPGSAGGYGACKVSIPLRNGKKTFQLLSTDDTVRIYDAITCIGEVVITHIAEKQFATILNCVGVFSEVFSGDRARTWFKPWADTRIDEGAWQIDTSTDAYELGAVARQNAAIRITPSTNDAWANGDLIRLKYTAPTGETVKRVTCTAQLAEGGAETWEIRMTESDGTTVIWNRTAEGTGDEDETLATADQTVFLEFRSLAAQTSADPAETFGEITALVMYTETGTIDALEILKDVMAKVDRVNTSEVYLDDSLSLPSLVPFFTNGEKKQGEIVNHALSFGTDTFESMSVFVDHSEAGATPDGDAIVRFYQTQDLDDHEWIVSAENEPGVTVPDIIHRAYQYNGINVQYRLPENNKVLTLTPADNVLLHDSDLVDDFGTQYKTIDVGLTTAALALQIGRAALARALLPYFYMSGTSIKVSGRIRNKFGVYEPVTRPKPGDRLLIDNSVQDFETLGEGFGLIVTITGTRIRGIELQLTAQTGDDLSLLLRKRQGELSLSSRGF